MTVSAEATAIFHETMPFAAELGIEVLSYTKDETCSRLAWTPSRCTAGGVMHGGVLMTLADANGAALAFVNLPEGAAGTTTIESKTNFLRAIKQGYATARSHPLHIGRRIIVIETDILDDTDRLVARVTQSQAVL
jgi:1,4-dihydroxy-2-naphthoyl-CoA hydrolase